MVLGRLGTFSFQERVDPGQQEFQIGWLDLAHVSNAKRRVSQLSLPAGDGHANLTQEAIEAVYVEAAWFENGRDSLRAIASGGEKGEAFVGPGLCLRRKPGVALETCSEALVQDAIQLGVEGIEQGERWGGGRRIALQVFVEEQEIKVPPAMRNPSRAL